MKKIFRNIFLFFISLILSISLFEITIRFFIKPSAECYGILFNNIELPPFTLRIRNKVWDNYQHKVNNLIMDGKKITKDDLAGIYRPDHILGYVPKENAISHSGWWQSNNLGARYPRDIAKNISLGMQRVIIFGDSFTNCHGVPNRETWPFFLDNKSKNVEFINFGAGAYSMSQCLLRYETIRNKVNYDVSMLVFVPTFDLPRDINMLRQLGGLEKNFPLTPRFIVEDNKLKLVKSPYKTYRDFLKENIGHISPQLKEYLQAYDRFYFRPMYESPPFWGELVSYKLFLMLVYDYRYKSIQRNVIIPKSEAISVSLKIFERMNEDTKHDGKKFILIVLPSRGDITNYNKNHQFQQYYDNLISSIKEGGIICIDLMKDMSDIKPSLLDKSYDGSHYGPKSNRIISEILWHNLKVLKLIVPP